MRATIYSILISLLTLSATCNKRIDCKQTDYSFKINAKAFPDKDSINIGDTIWVTLDEPIRMTNLITNNIVNFQGAANLDTAISFIELLGNKQSRNSAGDFNLKVIDGQQIPNPKIDLIREIVFLEVNNKYVFKLAIIPKRMGVFRIGLSHASNVYTKNDKCSKAFFRINFKETSQHLYFNEWNYNVTVPLPYNGYCFKVK